MSQLTLVSWNVRGLNTYGVRTVGQGRTMTRIRELTVELDSLLHQYVGPSHEIWLGLQEHKIQIDAERTALRAVRALAPRTLCQWGWARGTQGGTALIQYRKPPNPTMTYLPWTLQADTAPARWQGRWTRQSITWAGSQGYLITIYAPTLDMPAEQNLFYQHIFAMVSDLISNGQEIVLMGDFNIDLNEHPAHRTASFYQHILDLNLQDVIRSRDQEHTWLATRLGVRTTRRLDKIYITPKWADLVCHASVERSTAFSDHYPCIVTLAHHTQAPRGPGIPRINKILLQDDQFYFEIMQRWSNWRTHKDSYTDCCTWMQEGLAKMLEYSHTYSLNVRREKGRAYRIHQRIVNKLQLKPHLNHYEQARLQSSQTELDKLRFERHALALDSENLWWHQVGERMTKDFFALIPPLKSNSIISEIQDEQGTHTATTPILESGHRFYTSLFQNEPNPEADAAIAKILQAIPRRLTLAQQHQLDQTPSMEEATNAMQNIRTGSAPGVDGLPIEFWKTFWSLLHVDFYQCILEIWQHGQITGQWAETALILLFKKGDKTQWKNYRPIRLLTVAYKIISKIIQQRLYSVLDCLIGPEQVGFRANLHINDSITLIMDIVEKAWRDDIAGFILFWDFEKAFDRMCWAYLRHILIGLGFGPRILTVIMGMIKSLTWYILINGHKSALGHSSRSLPQGDCMSPILFLLAHAGLFWLHQHDPRLQGFPLAGSAKGVLLTAGRWGGVQRMSLRGKALIVNQLLFSKVLYYCLAHPPNDHTIQLIQRIGSNFVWKQKGLISHTVHGWISRDMSFMSWLHGGLGLHNIQWRLWSMYAKQVISVYMEVNTHPGCLLAKESLSASYTHANGTSWHLDAGVLGCTLISYKGLPWYWSRLWLGYHKLKPGRLVFPTTREEVARQILYFNDLIVDNARKPLGTLHGHNPYAGFLCASPPVLRVLDLYAWQGDRYRLRAYTEVNAWVQNMPSLHAWNTLIQAIPATWHAVMMAPRKALQPGDWISFYPDGITSTCKGLVRGVLPPAGIQVQVADTLPGHNGCLNQLATLCVCLPAHQCHRIRMVPWLVSRSCMFQPDPTTPAEAITWLHVGNTRLDTLPLDPLEFGWTLTKGMSRISKCLYEYTAEWGYDILLHENHKLHPGRPRWGFQWPGYSWIKLITLAVDHPLVDRRATDIQHLLLHRAIGVNATLSSRFHHDATCLCTFPSETIEHRFLYCQVSGVWQWLFNVWSAWTALPHSTLTLSVRCIIFGMAGTPGEELSDSQLAWVWLRTNMLYAIWTIRNETVFKVRHEYTKAAVVRRFIFLWNSAMRRAWLLAQEQYKVWDPGPNNDRPSPLELFHALLGRNRVFTCIPHGDLTRVTWLPWSHNAPF
eukprot:jgi/Mesvir1/29690/Mv25408-RA.1